MACQVNEHTSKRKQANKFSERDNQFDPRVCTCLQMIHRLGKEINHPDSIYYWAYKNDVPVYCPALTDGSLGDMLYFHTFKNPGLILDIVADIRAMNDEAMKAPPRKTGVIILGGGKPS